MFGDTPEPVFGVPVVWLPPVENSVDQHPFLAPHHEHMRELEPLGGVNGGQAHCVGIGIASIKLRQDRDRLRELRERRTLVLCASGTLAGRLGKDRAFAVTLLVGIVILFAGFLVASASPQRRTD